MLHLKEYPSVVKSVMENGQQMQWCCEGKQTFDAGDTFWNLMVVCTFAISIWHKEFKMMEQLWQFHNWVQLKFLINTTWVCRLLIDIWTFPTRKNMKSWRFCALKCRDPSSNIEAVVAIANVAFLVMMRICGDGELKKKAELSHPKGVTIAADKTMYIVNRTNIHAVDSKGIIYNLIGHNGHHNH